MATATYTLKEVSIYRDGGLLGAVFLREDGREHELHFRIARWIDDSDERVDHALYDCVSRRVDEPMSEHKFGWASTTRIAALP